jgi:Trk-type K+ transport system membrane component
MSWLDALFTSTSAVCVTGLIVEDTAVFFTPLGQGFVLLLIQLGGLGMLTFASLIIMALGQRLSLRAQATSIVTPESALHLEGRNITRDIVRFTFLFEAHWCGRVVCVVGAELRMERAPHGPQFFILSVRSATQGFRRSLIH